MGIYAEMSADSAAPNYATLLKRSIMTRVTTPEKAAVLLIVASCRKSHPAEQHGRLVEQW